MPTTLLRQVRLGTVMLLLASSTGLGQIVRTPFRDDFDPDIDASQWSAFSGTIESNMVGQGSGLGSVGNSLWFGGAGSRSATTRPIEVLPGDMIGFSVASGSGGSRWDPVESGDGLLVEYSVDGGNDFKTFAGPYYNVAWRFVLLRIPNSAVSPATLFRFRQQRHSGPGTDHLAIEDVRIGAISAVPSVTGPTFVQTLAGDEFSHQVTASGRPFRFRAEGMPEGLSIDPDTGLLSGRLDSEGRYTIELFLTNEIGTTSESFEIEVVEPAAIASLFNNPTYVDAPGRAARLQESLESIRVVVRPFTGIDEADWASAFDSDVIVIPPLDRNALDLSPEARAVINARIAGGSKGLVVMGAAGSNEEQLLNSLRGWGLENSISQGGGTFPKTPGLSLFSRSPDNLAGRNGTYLVARASLPAGAVPVYQTPSGEHAAVFTEGPVGYLGYDWLSGSNPQWEAVLLDTIASITSPPADPPIFFGLSEQSAITGRDFSYQIRASARPTAFAAEGLPEGLTLDPATGLISGITETPGTFSIEVSATNDVGTTTGALQLEVLNVSSTVALFSDPAYVDVIEETARARATLENLGFQVIPFTGITEADWTSAFASGLVVIPDLEVGSPGLSPEAIATINAQLAGGPNGLVVMGSAGSNDEQLLNSLLGWSLANSINQDGGTFPKTPGLSLFSRSPDNLPGRNGTSLVARASLPAGAVPVYQTPSGEHTVVFTEGPVGYLGYDWFSGPDPQWDAVLLDTIASVTRPPTAPPIFSGSLEPKALTGRAFSYQIRASSRPTAFTAEGLPEGLALDPDTGLISGITETPGTFSIEVSATNDIGTATASLELTVIGIPPSEDLRIIALETSGARIIEHGPLTGDDRGGVVVSHDRVFVNGDSSAAAYRLDDLGAGRSVGRVVDGLCSNLATGAVYTLALDGNPIQNNGAISAANQLLELDPVSGEPSGLVIELTETIPLNAGGTSGIFSGWGRVVIHNGSRVYDIIVPSGAVLDLGPMTAPAWSGSENWAIWGVAEFFADELHIAYRSAAGSSIVRSRVPDGATETIATFTNLSDLASWTVSPQTGRWFFHHEGSSQFGGGDESLGFADAILDAGPLNAPPIFFGSLEPRALTGRAFRYQIRASARPTAFAAEGLPEGLVIDPATGLISGVAQTPGTFSIEVSATNDVGTTTASLELTVIEVPPSEDLRIIALETSGARIIEHGPLTGDDRGGVVVSHDRVFVNGDSSAAAYRLDDLGGGRSLGRVVDGLCSNLATGAVYTLALDGNPIRSNGAISAANQLLELDPVSGEPSGLVIELTETIPLNGGGYKGIFSGWGRVVVHNGARVYDIIVPNGAVLDLGPMAPPAWSGSENWAIWGVAEFFADELHIAYRSAAGTANSIVRSRVPDGATETIATFTNLSDLASWTISPQTGRWFFHHEGSSQFGGGDESLGFADAILDAGPPTAPPILIGSLEPKALTRRAFRFQIRASARPTAFTAEGLPEGLALDPATGLISGITDTPGTFSIDVSATNDVGTTTASLELTVIEVPPSEDFRIAALETSGARVIEHGPLTGNDRGGVVASLDRVFVNGDASAAAYRLGDLGGGRSLGRIVDGLCSNLATGAVYTLALDGNPIQNNGTISAANQLIKLNPVSGEPSSLVIELTETIPLNAGGTSGIFSGWGRVVVHNGSRVYDIIVPNGAVLDLGPMAPPAWNPSENWAVWGVAEFFADELHIAYRSAAGSSIVRSRVPDGATETIATFTNLGDLASWTVSPRTGRWFFHHQGSNEFGGSGESLGFAAAILDAGPPTAPPILLGSSGHRALAGRAFRYQIRASARPTAFAAEGLPEGLTLDPATGLISGVADTPGTFSIEVSATNDIGTTTASLELVVIEIPPPDDFRVIALETSGARIIENGPLTGDDRGGVVVSHDRVFVNGDSSAASYRLDDLGGGRSLGRIVDGLCSNLATGAVYTLALDGNPIENNGAISAANQLLELDPVSGGPSSLVIELSEAISLNGGGTSGVFSGWGRVVVHNGARVYDITLADGAVLDLGPMAPPAWNPSESWAVWGVAEFFDDELHIAYRSAAGTANSIVRSRVPDGATETIATFTDLGDLATWTVSPQTGRWFFQYEGSSEFGSGGESLGFADAILDAGPPTAPPIIVGSSEHRALTGRAFRYQIRASARPTAFTAEGLPEGLTLDPATGLISGITETPGTFSIEVSATNDIGTTTASLEFVVIEIPPPGDFRIVALETSGARIIEHGPLTGDDRGGIVASHDRVFVNGDSAAAAYRLDDLGGGRSVGRVVDGLCSNLATGAVYTLALDGNPIQNNGTISAANQLLELDPVSGGPSGLVIELTEAIPLNAGGTSGVFSGWGRVVVHNGSRVYDITLADGSVLDLGPMAPPAWSGSENWAIWGVAEFFDDELHIAYRSAAGSSIVRSRVPDGATETIATFTNLSDLASWTVSPQTGRWFFHHEGSSQFGGGDESLGFADAILDAGPPTAPPILLGSLERSALTGRAFSYQIRASARPTAFAAEGLPEGLVIDPATGLISGVADTPGTFSIEVSATNDIGTTTASLELVVIEISPPDDFRIIALETSGARIIEHGPLTGDDRGGVVVSHDRVFVNGDSSAASYRLDDLGGGRSLGRIVDGLCSNLATGAVYTLALDGNPIRSNGAISAANQLLELDPVSGEPSGLVIELTEAIPLNVGGSSGIFSGWGRIVVHNGARVYDITLADGAVLDLGPMAPPAWSGSENWAIWGVAEFFADELHIAYRSAAGTGNSIVRSRVPDGATETIATFTNLSDLASWTVSPQTGRWFFHHEGSSQFGGGDESLGFADAILDAGPPTAPPIFFGSLEARALTGRAFRFQIRASARPTAFAAEGLPEGLVIDPATGLISGVAQTPGTFSTEVSATNDIGTATASLEFTVIGIPPSEDLRIIALETSNSRVIEHGPLTGDDRGGVVVSHDRVFVNGDSSAASYRLDDLGGGRSLGRVVDGICSNLATGAVYTLALDGNPIRSNGAISAANQLLELDPVSGEPSGLVIELTETIPLNSGATSGIFSGWGRVVVHNGARVYDIIVPNGAVLDLGPMAPPTWSGSENWAIWGVAEFFANELHIAYRSAAGTGNSIVRSRVPDGATETIATFTNLSDLASWTVSPQTGRWFFHHEGSSQFGGRDESVGFADAILDAGPPTAPPILLGSLERSVLTGRTFSYQIRASARPTAFAAEGLPEGLTLDPATGLISGIPAVAGIYPIALSVANEIGTSLETLYILVEQSLNFLFDDFDPDTEARLWGEFGGTVQPNTFGGAAGAGSTGNSLWFGGSGSRFATTAPLDVRGGGEVSFMLAMGNGFNPWEMVDPGEEIVVEYSVDGGTSFVAMAGPFGSPDWTRITEAIPPEAQTASTQFRIRQLTHSGEIHDNWAIDDVRIGPPANSAPTFPGMSVSIPQDTSIAIGGSKISSRASDPDGDTVRILSVDATSANGATLTFEWNVVTYTAPPSFVGDDSFGVTLTDGSSPATGTIMVRVTPDPVSFSRNVPRITGGPNGEAHIEYIGIPGFVYGLERSTNLVDWVRLSTPRADSSGRIALDDPDPPHPRAFYRMTYPAR